MRIGFIGLGRMGANMVRRLIRDGHEIVVYNRTPEKTREIAGEGAIASFSIEEMVGMLEGPRAVWIMVPAGDATEAQIAELMEHLQPGDTIIDGGNTNFHDDQRRHPDLKGKGINYVDAGVSGGIWGLQVGYCLMVGGDKDAVDPLLPIFTTLAPPNGYMHVGGPGAGHYVKMVHNGIEYGLMQAYAEGFEIMHASDYDLDLGSISELWMQGSVVRSWLLELAGRAADGVILGTGFDLLVYDWAKQKIRAGSAQAGRKESDVAVIAAGMLCVRDDGNEARKIVRNRIANRAHHNFRFTYETVPPEELDGVKKFMAGFDVMKPMEDRVDPDLVNDYLVHRFSIAGTPKECIERIEELNAAGVEHLMLTAARKVYHESVEIFATKVIPHIRK